MTSVKPTPMEIVERLQIVAALMAEGRPISEALRSTRMTEVQYERWRTEYEGLLRTLGPLWRASSKIPKGVRRTGTGGRKKPTK